MAALQSNEMEGPPTKLMLRGREGVRLLRGPRSDKNLEDKEAVSTCVEDDVIASANSDLSEFSPDGRQLVRLLVNKGIEILDTESSSVPPVMITDIPSERVQKFAWSPKSSFLVTWHKPEPLDKGEAPPAIGNLRIYEAKSGAMVSHFSMKKISSMSWPVLQWTSDESLCLHLVTNEIHVFKSDSMREGTIGKIRVPGLASMSVSPSATLPVKVAVFIPEMKGRPASVVIHQFPQLDQASSSKTFYNAQDCTMDWSPNGSACLIKTHTDVDTTGSSYYGSTGLYLIHSEGGFEASVPLQKEGPISDAKWSPNNKFVVICGTMPAVATLYDMKANPIFNFGNAHRCNASWSPHGRFLCLAGFGNLAGDMDFWDMNKLKKMGSNNSHCAVTYGWSPDSRFFMTATCAPRMNVDNGVKLFRYNGSGPILELPYQQLFDCRWRPASSGVYPDRPQSPQRNDPSNKANASKSTAAIEPPKVQAYRAPGSSGRLAAMMRADREGSGPGKLSKASSAAAVRAVQPNLPIGANPVQAKESNSAKNKAKKERKKKAMEADAAARAEMEKISLNDKSPGGETAAAASEPVDPAKRLKKLEKALKAIDAIKEKKASGAEINEDQKQKLKTESDVMKEIEDLKKSM